MNLELLVNNPNAYSILAIKQYVMQGKENRDAVETILGRQALENILRCPPLPEVPSFEPAEPGMLADSTIVFVWGGSRSGKTSVIASLLAAVKGNSKLNMKVDGNRNKGLQDMFAMAPDDNVGGTIINPESAIGHNCCASIVVKKRHGIFSRSYPITFFEVPMEGPSGLDRIPKGIIDLPQDQIHIFCIDPSDENENPAFAIDEQSRKIRSIIDYLDSTGVIKNKTNGIYILVTKSDTMYRVPREYRDEAAQTMITMGQPSLWQRVRNICYSKGIYGATPIVYSIGDVRYRSIVKTDHAPARHLMNVILNKSQAQKSLLERILTFGNGWLTIIVFSFVLGFAGYGLFRLCVPDVLPPTEKNVPFDYREYFMNKVKEDITEGTWESSTAAFDLLLNDINKESRINRADGSPLLSDTLVASCTTTLYEEYATVLHRTVKNEFDSSAWDNTLLRKALNQGDRLLQGDHLKGSIRSKILNDCERLRKYFNEIMAFINRSDNCRSMSDVEAIFSKAGDYNVEPYSNNSKLKQQLSEAKTNAVNSYTNALRQQAQRIKDEWDNTDFYEIFDKGGIKERATELESEVSDLMQFADDHGLDLNALSSILDILDF